MEPPEKGKVIDFMDRLKEKVETERSTLDRLKEKTKNEGPTLEELLTEADLDKFKAGVIFAIAKIQEDMTTILGFFMDENVRQMRLADVLYYHSHNESGLLETLDSQWTSGQHDASV